MKSVNLMLCFAFAAGACGSEPLEPEAIGAASSSSQAVPRRLVAPRPPGPLPADPQCYCNTGYCMCMRDCDSLCDFICDPFGLFCSLACLPVDIMQGECESECDKRYPDKDTTMTCKGDQPIIPCQYNSNCPLNQICALGRCIDVPAGRCLFTQGDSQCPSGTVCHPVESLGFCGPKCTSTAACLSTYRNDCPSSGDCTCSFGRCGAI